MMWAGGRERYKGHWDGGSPNGHGVYVWQSMCGQNHAQVSSPADETSLVPSLHARPCEIMLKIPPIILFPYSQHLNLLFL